MEEHFSVRTLPSPLPISSAALPGLFFPFSFECCRRLEGRRTVTRHRFHLGPLYLFIFVLVVPYGIVKASTLLRPGLDNTRLFMSFTAGAGTRCMSLLSSSPSPYGRLMPCPSTRVNSFPSDIPAPALLVEKNNKWKEP